MIFSYHHVKEHTKLFLAMTGLTVQEFEHLLPHFLSAFDQHIQSHYIDREDRQRRYGGGRQASTLVAMEDKLLFILYYCKVYPLQEILAFEFGMSQSTAHEWIHLLSKVLQQALAHGGYGPERDPQHLATVLHDDPTPIYALDGTERPRQRPSDAEKQQDYYSGKKKRIPSKIS